MSIDEEVEAAPSEEQLRVLCSDLLRDWAGAYVKNGSVELGREDQEADSVRFTVVLAFVAHTHHVTAAAAQLMHAGDYPSAIPLLRVGYETALTAAWAANSEEAARALHGRYVGNARKLLTDAQATGWFDELLENVTFDDAIEVAPSAKGEAEQFANMCHALEPNGTFLYVMYRLLSGYSHPSGAILSMYAPGDVGESVSLSPEPEFDQRSWWHAAAMNLLHPGQALDHLDRAATRRESLASASAVIGWPSPLRLTDAAVRRIAEARAARASR